MKRGPDMSTYLTTLILPGVEHSASITSDDLVVAILCAMHWLGPEPIAEEMKIRGFDPARGCVLLIPPQDDIDKECMPSYVKVSPLVTQPLLIDMSSLDLTIPHEWHNI